MDVTTGGAGAGADTGVCTGFFANKSRCDDLLFDSASDGGNTVRSTYGTSKVDVITGVCDMSSSASASK